MHGQSKAVRVQRAQRIQQDQQLLGSRAPRRLAHVLLLQQSLLLAVAAAAALHLRRRFLALWLLPAPRLALPPLLLPPPRRARGGRIQPRGLQEQRPRLVVRPQRGRAPTQRYEPAAELLLVQ